MTVGRYSIRRLQLAPTATVMYVVPPGLTAMQSARSVPVVVARWYADPAGNDTAKRSGVVEVFLTVVLRILLAPTLTLPQYSVLGLEVNVAATPLPVALRLFEASPVPGAPQLPAPVLAELVVTPNVAAGAAPSAVGLKEKVRTQLLPGAIAWYSVPPAPRLLQFVALRCVGVTTSYGPGAEWVERYVTVAVDVFFTVTCTFLVPCSVTFPKATEVGLRVERGAIPVPVALTLMSPRTIPGAGSKAPTAESPGESA
jgi:hypothetical protein